MCRCYVLSEGAVYGVLSGGDKCSSLSHVLEFVLPLFSPPLLLQLPIPSGSTGHVEETSSKRTAQLSWPPTKRRRSSDAEGTRTVPIC